jgi:hypothetical protein
MARKRKKNPSVGTVVLVVIGSFLTLGLISGYMKRKAIKEKAKSSGKPATPGTPAPEAGFKLVCLGDDEYPWARVPDVVDVLKPGDFITTVVRSWPANQGTEPLTTKIISKTDKGFLVKVIDQACVYKEDGGAQLCVGDPPNNSAIHGVKVGMELDVPNECVYMGHTVEDLKAEAGF